MATKFSKSLTLSANGGKPGRRERRREETRTRIYTCAMQLFAEHGFANVTVEQITEAADVGKGTFFNYFPTKEHILMALTEMQRRVVQNLAEAAKNAPKIKPLLSEFAHQIARGPGRSQRLLRSLLGFALTHEPVGDRMAELLEIGRETLAGVMKRGQKSGELRSDLPAHELARMFQTIIFGTNSLWSLQAGMELNTWLDQSVEMFWRGAAVNHSAARKQKEVRNHEA